MKVLIIVMFAALAYGFLRFLLGMIKELAEIVLEAWHSGEAEH